MTDGKFDLALFLEVMNGTWAILSVFLLYYMVPHLFAAWRLRRITLREFMLEQPVSIQLVVAMGVYHTGSLMTRGTIWFSRFMGIDGQISSMYLNNGLLTLGAAIAVTGLLCQIRVITQPVYGVRPWVTAAATAAAFAAATVWKAHAL